MTAISGPDAADHAADDAGSAALFRAIDHVGIAVADYDAALAFYRDSLGMRVVHEETNVEQGVREAMLEVGPDSGPRLQLLAALDERSPIAKFLRDRGPGVQQLAFRVDDAAAAGQALRARGLRTLSDQPVPGTAGSSIMFVHPKDVGGVLVELVQPAVDDPSSTPSGT